jgi:Putative peptidoglycan binding domain
MSDGVMREPGRISINVADPFGQAPTAASRRFGQQPRLGGMATRTAPWWAVALLAVAGLAGWALFGLAAGAKNERIADLQAAVAEVRGDLKVVTAERDRLKTELDRLRTTWGDLAQMEAQLNAARQENARLGDLRERLLSDVAQSTATAPGTTAPRLGADRLPAGTVMDPPDEAPPLTRSEIIAAQRALTRLGFGRLPLDGEIGRRTRRAIQAFERRQGLPVTGELGPGTREALARATGEPVDQAGAER